MHSVVGKGGQGLKICTTSAFRCGSSLLYSPSSEISFTKEAVTRLMPP